MLPHLPPHIVQSSRHLQGKCGTPLALRFYQHDGDDYRSLKEMYQVFEPKEWSQGLPPRLEHKREEWLLYMVNEGINLLAIMEGKVVGHAALFEMEHGRSYEYLIFVHQQYQDRGIGTALTEMIKELAKEMGFDQIWLTVATINRKAIHVYQKVGFCIVGPRDVECVMMLPLKQGDPR